MRIEQFDGHTPGPWNVSDEVGLVIKHGGGAHDFVDMENGANARLMAAAPDLLAEVKRLHEMLALWEICRGCFITYDECTCGGDGE